MNWTQWKAGVLEALTRVPDDVFCVGAKVIPAGHSGENRLVVVEHGWHGDPDDCEEGEAGVIAVLELPPFMHVSS